MHYNEHFPKERKVPDITGLEFYAESYGDLATNRVNGGAIPFDSIINYVKFYKINDPDFFDIIRIMDDNYLKASSEKEALKGKNGKSTN